MSWWDLIFPEIKILIDIIIIYKSTTWDVDNIAEDLQTTAICQTSSHKHLNILNEFCWWLPLHCKANFSNELLIFFPLPVMDNKSAKTFLSRFRDEPNTLGVFHKYSKSKYLEFKKFLWTCHQEQEVCVWQHLAPLQPEPDHHLLNKSREVILNLVIPCEESSLKIFPLDQICVTYDKVKLAAKRGRLVYVAPAYTCIILFFWWGQIFYDVKKVTPYLGI